MPKINLPAGMLEVAGWNQRLTLSISSAKNHTSTRGGYWKSRQENRIILIQLDQRLYQCQHILSQWAELWAEFYPQVVVDP